MIESVNVGFLCIEVFHPVGVLWIVMSRYISLLLVSSSFVNFRLVCNELNSSVCLVCLCGRGRRSAEGRL